MTVKKLLCYDVCPFDYGVETAGGVMTVLIPKNSEISLGYNKTDIFTTYNNNQKAVWVKLYEGERQMVKDNVLIEKIRLENIPSLPRGLPFIEINLRVDCDNLIKLKAKDKSEEDPEIVKQIGTAKNNSILFDYYEAIMKRIDPIQQNKFNMNFNNQFNPYMQNMPPQMYNQFNPNMNNPNMFGMNYQNMPNFNNQFNPQMNFQNNPNMFNQHQ